MSSPAPRLIRSAPYFPVADVDAATEEYRTRFGFTVDYIAGAPAVFAIVSRDDLHLMLRRVPPECRIIPNAAQGGSWDVFFWVEGVDALFRELTERGGSVVYPPVNRDEYQMREFALSDSTGYILGFGEAL